MHSLVDALAFIGTLTFIVGWVVIDYRFKKRLGLGYFSIRWETMFWPFYYNRHEWTSLLLALGIGLSLIVIAATLGAYK